MGNGGGSASLSPSVNTTAAIVDTFKVEREDVDPSYFLKYPMYILYVLNIQPFVVICLADVTVIINMTPLHCLCAYA